MPIALRQSPLERKLALILYTYLPDESPDWDYRFHATRKWEIDCAFVDCKVAVECDGGYFRADGGRHNGKRDEEKMVALTADGWLILHFTAPELRHSVNVAQVIAAVLFARRHQE